MNNHRRSSKASARLLAGVAGAALLGMSGAAHGQFVNGQSASLELGQPDFKSNTAALSRSGEEFPGKTVFDHLGDMWVSDTCNSRVLEYKRPFTTGMPASLVLGAPNFTTSSAPEACYQGTQPAPPTAGNFFEAQGIMFDPAGFLWVVDLGNNRVLVFLPPSSNGMSASAVLGQPDFTSNAPGGGTTGFNVPFDVAFDPLGNPWVSDAANNRVVELKVSPADTSTNVLFIGQPNSSDHRCTKTQSGLCFPTSLAFDYLGDLWVADTFNDRILEYRPPFHTGMNASLVVGQKDFVSSVASAGKAGLDLNIAAFGVSFFGGITFGEKGALWVGDSGNSRVLEFKPPFVTGMNASRVLGQDDFLTTTGATSANGMWLPGWPGYDLSFSDTLWVPDSNNNRVLEFKPHGGK